MIGLAGGLRRAIFGSSASSRPNLDQTMSTVSDCQKRMFDGQTKAIQKRVCMVYFAMQRVMSRSRLCMPLRLWIGA